MNVAKFKSMFARIELLAKQKHCAICGARFNEASREPCMDHNHDTGQPRELLCRRCNFLLGYARESTEILLAAVAYLKKHKENV